LENESRQQQQTKTKTKIHHYRRIFTYKVTHHRQPSVRMVKRVASKEHFKVIASNGEEELSAPLLRSDSETEFGQQVSSASRMEISSGSDPMFYADPIDSNGAARVVNSLLQIRTVADALPTVFQAILTSGKMSAMVFLGSYLFFVALWFPVYLFSFISSEMGIYALSIGMVFLVGRSIIRLIAFPGSTNRVSSEMEKEFSKYSTRILVSSSTSIIDLAQAILSASNRGDNNSSNPGYSYYEIPQLWKRAKSYRDRVIAVYAEVLQYIYNDRNSGLASPLPSDLTKYENNQLSGDIGDLSGLTVSSFCAFWILDSPNCAYAVLLLYLQLEARSDGKILLDHLSRVLSDMDRLEEQAKGILESTTGQSQPPSNSVLMVANSLVITASDLRNFTESLGPSLGKPNGFPSDSEEESLSVDAVRRRFEEQNSSLMDSINSGVASILPMLDPPLHTSIFGFDVQRGCMLARYYGARQLWVQRPGGGMIDALHIPAKSCGPHNQRNPKAVMYCNPNAGLIEVATGMSLAGGNIASDSEGVVNDNCWTDFYTNLGFDVYLFNYAGFGRSYGSGCCGLGKTGGEEPYIEGVYGRIKRIIHGTFFSFQVCTQHVP
jgi:hypothetical protein